MIYWYSPCHLPCKKGSDASIVCVFKLHHFDTIRPIPDHQTAFLLASEIDQIPLGNIVHIQIRSLFFRSVCLDFIVLSGFKIFFFASPNIIIMQYFRAYFLTPCNEIEPFRCLCVCDVYFVSVCTFSIQFIFIMMKTKEKEKGMPANDIGHNPVCPTNWQFSVWLNISTAL